jgi:hypothetical protein
MEKIPTSQALGIYSGFLTPIKTIGAQKPCFVRNDIQVHFSATGESGPLQKPTARQQKSNQKPFFALECVGYCTSKI